MTWNQRLTKRTTGQETLLFTEESLPSQMRAENYYLGQLQMFQQQLFGSEVYWSLKFWGVSRCDNREQQKVVCGYYEREEVYSNDEELGND